MSLPHPRSRHQAEYVDLGSGTDGQALVYRVPRKWWDIVTGNIDAACPSTGWNLRPAFHDLAGG